MVLGRTKDPMETQVPLTIWSVGGPIKGGDRFGYIALVYKFRIYGLGLP